MAAAGRFIRVLIVDRHAVARQGLRALLDQARSFTVLETETVEAAVDLVRDRPPDLILLGTADPDAITTLADASPTSRIIVLGLHDDPLYARRALDAGAAAYLPRDNVDGDLPAALAEASTRPPSHAAHKRAAGPTGSIPDV